MARPGGRHPDAEFVDASALLWELRMIKSEAEIALIAECDRINGEGLAKAFGALKAGDSEMDVAREVSLALVAAGAWRPPYAQTLIVSESKSKSLGHTARMLGPLPDQILNPGELLFVDSGVVINGYWGEFNRMAVVGEPSADQSLRHDHIRTIVRRSIEEAIKPGVTFKSVIEKMASYYYDFGYSPEKIHNYLGKPFMHLCHGIGISASEPPFVRYDSEDVLKPGMVLSCEAYLPHEGMTYGSEEDIVVTDTGAEILSEPDPGLYVIPA
ncbi:M24 family metallopeptidase [Mycolicibacterium phlei]